MSSIVQLPVQFQITFNFVECEECQERFAIMRDCGDGAGQDEKDFDAAGEVDFCPFCGIALI